MDLCKYDGTLKYVQDYTNAVNAATGSKFDANANVESKNVVTLAGEIPKGDFIGLNRAVMVEKITELYGEDLGKEYIRELEKHEIYTHDESNFYALPYCCSITLYPFLYDGLKKIGGTSGVPSHMKSYSGALVNLLYAIGAQFKGAVAVPEALMYLDYFIRKEYGDSYYLKANTPVNTVSARPTTIKKEIHDCFEHIVYALNEAAGARNFQSIFVNFAYYDKPYFEGLFGDFYFPDGSKPQWKSLSWLQKLFMKWFNNERLRNPLTFPVETMSLLNQDGKFVDEEWADFTAEMYSEGHSFFTYISSSIDSLASCCRLRNEIAENAFSFTLGAGGVSTGSKGVITININRLVQDATRDGVKIEDAVKTQVEKVHKYLFAYNEILKDFLKARMLPVYDAGFIGLDRQYLTLGVNGFAEGAEFLGITIDNNEEYYSYCESILRPIYELNKAHRTKEVMYNCEFVPRMSGDVKLHLIDLEVSSRRQGASVMAA